MKAKSKDFFFFLYHSDGFVSSPKKKEGSSGGYKRSPLFPFFGEERGFFFFSELLGLLARTRARIRESDISTSLARRPISSPSSPDVPQSVHLAVLETFGKRPCTEASVYLQCTTEWAPPIALAEEVGEGIHPSADTSCPDRPLVPLLTPDLASNALLSRP